MNILPQKTGESSSRLRPGSTSFIRFARTCRYPSSNRPWKLPSLTSTKTRSSRRATQHHTRSAKRSAARTPLSHCMSVPSSSRSAASTLSLLLSSTMRWPMTRRSADTSERSSRHSFSTPVTSTGSWRETYSSTSAPRSFPTSLRN